MSDFKVGDRVRSTAKSDVWHTGLTGEVVRVNEELIEVAFENHGDRGHEGSTDDFNVKGRWHFYFESYGGDDDPKRLVLAGDMPRFVTVLGEEIMAEFDTYEKALADAKEYASEFDEGIAVYKLVAEIEVEHKSTLREFA